MGSFECPKCGAERENAEADCASCGWRRAEPPPRQGGFRLFGARRLHERQAEEDAPGMRARKYVAFGVAILTSMTVAVGATWILYTGRDVRSGSTGGYIALPFGLVLGGAMSVAWRLFLRSLKPGYRLSGSLLVAAVVVLAALMQIRF